MFIQTWSFTKFHYDMVQEYFPAILCCLSRKNVIQMNIRGNFTEISSEQVTIIYEDARLWPTNMFFYILIKESESLKIIKPSNDLIFNGGLWDILVASKDYIWGCGVLPSNHPVIGHR